jgi:quercetin dioxygenase-like cupin family protein
MDATGLRHGRFSDVPADEPYPGVVRRTFDCERGTVAAYAFEAGAIFALHRHPEEQLTLIEEGEVELLTSGEPLRLATGSWAVTAPEVEHGIVAGPTGARIVIVVMPRRAHSPG